MSEARQRAYAIFSAPGKRGGAGLAAFRIWQSVAAEGADCDFVSASQILHADGRVSRFSAFERLAGKILGKGMAMYAQRRYPTAPRSNFHAWRPQYAGGLWRRRFAPYRLIDWHVPGRYFRMGSSGGPAQSQRHIVSLHDMWFLTGGCNYAYACEGYRTLCPECPLLGTQGEKRHCRTETQMKFETISQRVRAVTAPNRWLASSASLSRIFQALPVHVIPYGVSSEDFHPLDRLACRGELGIDPSDLVVGFGAQNLADERKGGHVLAEALRSLPSATRSRVVLLLFGDAVWPEDGVRCKSLGSLRTTDALSRAYSAMDVFVCSSLADNSPNTVIEAQLCGTPVIGSSAGGIPEMIESADSGAVVPANNAAALRDAIARCVETNVHEHWRVQVRDLAMKKWSPRANARLRLDVYQSILSAHG